VATRLARSAQLDFSAGMFRAVARHLVPANGAWDLLNYLLDEDGSPYRRGGGEFLSTSAFGSSLRFLWDGFLTPGQRTVIANPDDFGVLDAAEAPVNLGLGGLAAPKRAVELAGMLFIGGGTIYGGSRRTAGYSAGTVAVTNGSKTVTGSGTTWTTNIDAGGLFRVGGAGRYYVVASVESNTQLTLRDDFEGSTGSGLAYAVSNIASAAAPYRVSDLYAVAADRLFSLEGSRAYFTPPGNPHSFNAAEEFHELADGAQILGGSDLRDMLILFATSGVHVISNLHLDLTDPDGNMQHRVEHVSEDLILWSHEGIATWGGALVVPAADSVWLVDGVSAPVKVSRSIDGLYRAYVQAGYRTGLATVLRGHYFLPILDAVNAPVDLLVCRLDRPVSVRGFGTVYPWTHQHGFGRQVAAFAVRTGGSGSVRNPQLLAASTATSARVVKCNGWFGPDVAQKNEPDGSTHETLIDTRDYATVDGLSENTVRRVIVRYELKDAAADNPAIAAFWSDGSVDLAGLDLWDAAVFDTATFEEDDAGEWEQLEGRAPEDDGRNPHSWPVGKKVRFIRFRLRSASPSTRHVIRTVELLVRPSQKL
jgi:hypothetical protein